MLRAGFGEGKTVGDMGVEGVAGDVFRVLGEGGAECFAGHDGGGEERVAVRLVLDSSKVLKK